MYPISFPMKHYLFLSVEHIHRKYLKRAYDPTELEAGWHRARNRLEESDIALQPEAELRFCAPDGKLDPANPLQRHPLFVR